MSLVIPVSQLQLMHVAVAVMTGIHDVFPANEDNNREDPISEKKFKQLEAQYTMDFGGAKLPIGSKIVVDS